MRTKAQLAALQRQHAVHRALFLQKQVAVYEVKRQDYGSSFEDLVDKYGKISFLVRASDKIARLKNLMHKPPAVADESSADTVSDLLNYCALMEMHGVGAAGATAFRCALEVILQEGFWQHLLKQELVEEDDLALKRELHRVLRKAKPPLPQGVEAAEF